ncbi:phage tail protein [Schaalia sp. lx-100]|uniref:phage tail protein n=1 Tax=Schaalia sp. lx-100 TaxID=2899081 RepID=UPI003FA73605
MAANTLQTFANDAFGTIRTVEQEDTILRRNKPDSKGRNPWKAEAAEGASKVTSKTITD